MRKCRCESDYENNYKNSKSNDRTANAVGDERPVG